jgi:hypothetical protein
MLELVEFALIFVETLVREREREREKREEMAPSSMPTMQGV